MSGLVKGATYHVRLVAINADGLSLGADTTFTAVAPVAPNLAPAPPAPLPAAAGPGAGPGPAPARA
ncbi:MAG TPA: hypothetical protein VFY32_01060, partial [Solirubrobacteraceae bacterium]|nr:hypothetical protein [Solirubrobacteraceae bacterium]